MHYSVMGILALMVIIFATGSTYLYIHRHDRVCDQSHDHSITCPITPWEMHHGYEVNFGTCRPYDDTVDQYICQMEKVRK